MLVSKNKSKICLSFFAIIFIFTSCGKKNLPVEKLQNSFLENQPEVLTSLAFSGEPHWGSGMADSDLRLRIINKVSRRSYDSFVILGDIVEDGSKKDSYNNAVATLNQGLKETPVLVLPGNKDFYKKTRENFNEVFSGKGNKFGNYCLDFKGSHILVLDEIKTENNAAENQEKWLTEHLDKIPVEDKVLVLSHNSFISSRKKDSVLENFCSIFEKYKVDLVISGEDHLMELLEKNGVTYIVAGSMSGIFDRVEKKSSNSIWMNNTSAGFLDLNLAEKDKLSFAFFDSDGKHLKSYEIRTK